MSILSIGIEKGKAEGLASGKAEGVLDLLADLGPVPDHLKKQILAETDMETLTRWLKGAARAGSIEEFEKNM